MNTCMCVRMYVCMCLPKDVCVSMCGKDGWGGGGVNCVFVCVEGPGCCPGFC